MLIFQSGKSQSLDIPRASAGSTCECELAPSLTLPVRASENSIILNKEKPPILPPFNNNKAQGEQVIRFRKFENCFSLRAINQGKRTANLISVGLEGAHSSAGTHSREGRVGVTSPVKLESSWRSRSRCLGQPPAAVALCLFIYLFSHVSRAETRVRAGSHPFCRRIGADVRRRRRLCTLLDALHPKQVHTPTPSLRIFRCPFPDILGAKSAQFSANRVISLVSSSANKFYAAL